MPGGFSFLVKSLQYFQSEIGNGNPKIKLFCPKCHIVWIILDVNTKFVKEEQIDSDEIIIILHLIERVFNSQFYIVFNMLLIVDIFIICLVNA